MFESVSFIKPDIPFRKEDSLAPLFRRSFFYSGEGKKAVLSVCTLGLGRFYLNGKPVTEDIFNAPCSDYSKTLWYHTYDVTDFLQKGENVIAAICGNGWYNENMKTVWEQYLADWRDIPKLIMSLTVDGETLVTSDGEWKYTLSSPVTYNELRCGEHYDARLYDEDWNKVGYDDSAWEGVQLDKTPPTGVFRPCECEPIRECALYAPQKMHLLSGDRVIFDFGQNMSGYIRLRTCQEAGDKILLRYVERINEDFSLCYNHMDDPFFYPETPFQEDEFICNGEDFTYTPLFTYHGFRYVEVTGLKNPSLSNVVAVFVHQDIERRSHFECSDSLLNTLFEAGMMANLSNFFFMPTDCPTREKMGWMNDAQASAEQMLTNFHAERFLEKWEQDIFDAMRADGALPGIVPTAGWGYDWGNGPVSDGSLFEIPHRIYLHTGDDSLLKKAYPYFERYLAYLKEKTDENGEISFGLGDWACPDTEDHEAGLSAPFPNKLLLIKFLHIKKLAEERMGKDTADTAAWLEREIRDVKERYLTPDGECVIDQQTPVAMLICFGVYNDLEPLKRQLMRITEELDFHHYCGMVGIRYLYHALSLCGVPEYAYRIITAEGYPSYRNWVEQGMTTLFETWDGDYSRNHHMLSDVTSWMIKNILGIRQASDSVGFRRVELSPVFFEELNYAKGYVDTVKGRVSVSWEREEKKIYLTIDVAEGMTASYEGRLLGSGHYEFTK